ncbi:recombinase family protein [Phenylobacterium sp.]|uniref:recombinase family protein n=1 Tax=Phenylobacterium sp. TaxID=1871053 RepID=UPI002732BAF1|nr:recombinase family protein [Phenylobacterium sp.]
MSKAAPATKVVRCAIYTRKSSEEGLDQAFNSLHAQREACEAYIKSQVAEGWRVLPMVYDDGGFSGGTMTRPGLDKLLADVDRRRIDTVVVYKVDRLTRSLSDFAKIVDRLDAAGASFVSVTQAFNTTTSMGRLTLNVLLSFAQFEREVTGERIRDKIAASKAKGMWMGGNLPLGYAAPIDTQSRALVVDPIEAVTVRMIFQTYLALGSVHALEAWLDAEGIRSKLWTAKNGRDVGGARLSRGALFYLLKNRTYLGEIPHREKSYPGRHPAIIEAALFDAVQAKLGEHRAQWRERPLKAATMCLRGLLFDAEGAPMSPSFTRGRNGQIYRYYVSSPLQCGRPVKPNANAIHRVPASEIEALLRDQLIAPLGAAVDASLNDLLASVSRIEIEAEAVRVILMRSKVGRSALAGCDPVHDDPARVMLTLPIRCRIRGGRTRIVPPAGSESQRKRRRDPVLIRGLRQAHRLAAAMGWRCSDGTIDLHGARAPKSAYDRKLSRLAFLAPEIQRLILEGRQPIGTNLEMLVHVAFPTSWAAQRERLGLLEK